MFLVCSRYPKCEVSGTPALFEQLKAPCSKRDPLRIGGIVDPLVKLRVLQSRLNRAETDEERERIREEAMGIVHNLNTGD